MDDGAYNPIPDVPWASGASTELDSWIFRALPTRYLFELWIGVPRWHWKQYQISIA